MSFKLSKRLPLLICLYFVLLAVQYAQVMPPLETADEAGHLLYIHNLLQDRELPHIESRESIALQREAVRRWAVENHQPPLYYALGALLVSWTNRGDINAYLQPNELIFIRGINAANHHVWLHSPQAPAGDTHHALWILRLYSIALGAGTLWLIYQTVHLVGASCRDAPATGMTHFSLPLLAMLLVASIPTFISISASVNNDNLVTFLYTMGVYWSLRMWRRRAITKWDIIIVSLILAAAALAKVTGLSLYGVVYLALYMGVRRGDYPRRQALILAAASLIAFVTLAGWWYVRNVTLYGDVLALRATQSLWGREYEIAATSGDLWAELRRIGQSFWMMVGHLHLPVYGSSWLYTYAAVMTVIGLIGITSAFRRGVLSGCPDNRRADSFLGAMILLAAACLIVAAMLLVGTRSVDISYGRLLFPALVGFAPLMVIGWRQLLGRWLGAAVILPFALMALVFPAKYITQAYAPLAAVDSVPSVARPLHIYLETLELLAYEIPDDTLNPGDTLCMGLYLRGQHADDLAFVLTALDINPVDRLGQIEVYPGMAGTARLDPAQIYRAPLCLPILIDDAPLRPNRLALRLLAYDPAPYREIPMTDASGGQIETLLLDAATLVDPRYVPPVPQYPATVSYGGTIALEGYSFGEDGVDGLAELIPGADLHLTLHWRCLAPMDADWTVTVQVLDESGTVITQDDGMPDRYPTSTWRRATAFTDERILTFPSDTPPGAYRLLVGWYRREDLFRLPAAGADAVIEHDLFMIPHRIIIQDK